MSKNITDQIIALQEENEQLKDLQKIFEKALKSQFGCDAKTIKKSISLNQSFCTKLATYFNLKKTEDFDAFLEIFCTESSLNYFHKKRSHDNAADTN